MSTATLTTTTVVLHVPTFIPVGQGAMKPTGLDLPNQPPNVDKIGLKIRVRDGGTKLHFSVAGAAARPVGIMVMEMPSGMPVFIDTDGMNLGKLVPGCPFQAMSVQGATLEIDDQFPMPAAAPASPKLYHYILIVRNNQGQLGMIDPDLENEN